MRQQSDCFHKIISFQKHNNCKENASICENRCQKYHINNEAHSQIKTSLIFNRHQQIKGYLINALKVHTDRFAREYDQIMKNFQKKFTEKMREMERQILSHLIMTSNLNNEVMDKIENERLQKLKCNQIYQFISSHNIQQKIKSAPVLPIYEKHLNSLRMYYKNFNWMSSTEENKGNQQLSTQGKQKLLVPSLEISTKEENQKLKIQIESLKKQLKLALETKDNDVNGKGARQRKKERLTMKTWTIFRVISKKRQKKQQKDNQNSVSKEKQTPRYPQTPMEVEQPLPQSNPSESPCNNDSDSQDLMDFIEKKQRAK